jgi:hypothetical protein
MNKHCLGNNMPWTRTQKQKHKTETLNASSSQLSKRIGSPDYYLAAAKMFMLSSCREENLVLFVYKTAMVDCNFIDCKS